MIAGGLTIQQSAFGQATLYVQDFDGAAIPPALPAGWMSPNAAWTTSASVPSPGSGGQNVENRGGSPGELVTPVFDFSAVSSAALHFQVRRTATYDSLNLSVEASIDGGVNWPVTLLDSTESLPVSPSAYASVQVDLPAALLGNAAVRMRFRTLHATGGNMRLDDVEIIGIGDVAWSRIGFTDQHSTVPLGADSIRIPIGIHLIPSSPNLQGLQFTISFSDGLSFSSLRRNLAALNRPEWQFQVEHDDSTAAAVLLAEGTTGLEPVSSDSALILTLQVDPVEPGVDQTEVLALHGVVVSSATETGEDLPLAVEHAGHEVLVLGGSPSLTIDPGQIDFGSVRHDDVVDREVILTNLGTASLHVSDVFSASGLLSIFPTFATIAPGASQPVSVTLFASLFGTGELVDDVIIDHSGPASPDTVRVLGTISEPDVRGDANDDGSVDIVDLVLGVDLVLERLDLPQTRDRLDLHPFPAGNEAIDVRDLTVLAQAISRGVWPDGTVLQTDLGVFSKSAGVVGDVILSEETEGISLFVQVTEPVRALHIVGDLPLRFTVQPDTGLSSVHFGSPYPAGGTGGFSIVAFSASDEVVSMNQEVRLAQIVGARSGDLRVVSAVAVDATSQRRRLSTVYESHEVPSGTEAAALSPPYPNPVDSRLGAFAHFPILVREDLRGHLSVSDVLGRTVTRRELVLRPGSRVVSWDLRDALGSKVPPGVYFIRLAAPGLVKTQPLVVR